MMSKIKPLNLTTSFIDISPSLCCLNVVYYCEDRQPTKTEKNRFVFTDALQSVILFNWVKLLFSNKSDKEISCRAPA